MTQFKNENSPQQNGHLMFWKFLELLTIAAYNFNRFIWSSFAHSYQTAFHRTLDAFIFVTNGLKQTIHGA